MADGLVVARRRLSKRAWRAAPRLPVNQRSCLMSCQARPWLTCTHPPGWLVTWAWRARAYLRIQAEYLQALSKASTRNGTAAESQTRPCEDQQQGSRNVESSRSHGAASLLKYLTTCRVCVVDGSRARCADGFAVASKVNAAARPTLSCIVTTPSSALEPQQTTRSWQFANRSKSDVCCIAQNREGRAISLHLRASQAESLQNVSRCSRGACAC